MTHPPTPPLELDPQAIHRLLAGEGYAMTSNPDDHISALFVERHGVAAPVVTITLTGPLPLIGLGDDRDRIRATRLATATRIIGILNAAGYTADARTNLDATRIFVTSYTRPKPTPTAGETLVDAAATIAITANITAAQAVALIIETLELDLVTLVARTQAAVAARTTAPR